MNKIRSFSAILLLCCLYSVPTFAGTDRNSEAESQSQTPNSSFTVYYKDPETGELTQPPVEFYTQMTDMDLNQSDEGLEIEVMPDGSERVNLQGRFRMHSAIVNQDGNVQFVCTDHLPDLHKIQPAEERAVR